MTPSSPRLPPASPALSALSDPEVVEWWGHEHLLLDEKLQAISQAVTEMQKYYAEWLHASRDAFWQRRSKKSVLSVLVCRGQAESSESSEWRGEGGWRIFRGMNTEAGVFKMNAF